MSTGSGAAPASASRSSYPSRPSSVVPPATMTSASVGSRSRTAVATAASTGSVMTTRAWQSLDEEGDLGRRHAEVHGHRDGAEQVGRQDRLDELGAVEHEDQNAVTRLRRRGGRVRPRARSRGGRAHPTSSCRPRKRSAVASGCISAWRASWLVQFCLRARYGCSTGCTVRMSQLAVIWCSPVSCAGCAELIFDQTLCCPGHTMAWAARGQPRATSHRVSEGDPCGMRMVNA